VVAVNNTVKLFGCIVLVLALTSHVVASTTFMDQPTTITKKMRTQPMIIQGGWPQIYSAEYQANALNIAIDSHDNILVTGFAVSQTSCNAVTIKYDNEGNELWNASYNSGTNDIGYCVSVDDNDDIIVFGYSGKLPVSEGDCFLVKYSADGMEQWRYAFSKGECDYPGGITTDSENNIIITGGSGMWQMNLFYWTIKLDSSGVELWNTTFHESIIDIGLGVTVDSQDHIITTGVSATPFIDPVFLIKYDKTGNILWEKRRSGNEPWDVTTDSQDNIIIVGSGYYGGSMTMLTMKCDKDGAVLWTNEYNSGGYDGGRGIAVDSKDNIIVGGFSGYSNPNYFEHCAILYASDGQEVCFKREGVEGLIYDVAVDSTDNIFITGVIEEGIYGYYTTKYGDITPPEVTLETPKVLYLHLNGFPLFQLPKRTIAIGKMKVSLESENPSDIEYVEIYINKLLMIHLISSPFEWIWEDRLIGSRTLEVIAYDNTGCAQRIDLDFWKLL
jgi:hypothetical protein